MTGFSWVTLGFDRPRRRFTKTEDPRPQIKKQPHPCMLPPMRGIRTDDEYREVMEKHEASDEPVCIMFGSSWCHHCHQVFPSFFEASKLAPDMTYYVAMVDYMKETTRDIRLTPTFCIYRGGKRVDQFLGDKPQRIADRVWLHSSASAQLL